MLSTNVLTTSSIEGHQVEAYLGVITAHVVTGTGFLSDFAASFTDFFGGRSETYQRQLASIQAEVTTQLWNKANDLGANFVLGTRFDFDQISGKNMQMFMVSAHGTAVRAHVRLDRAEASFPNAPLSRDAVRDAMQAAMLRQKCAQEDWVPPDVWPELARLNVLEGILPVLRYVHERPDRTRPANSQEQDAVPTKALQFLRALPPDDLRYHLNQLLETQPALEPHLVTYIRQLDLLDLDWVMRSLVSDEFRIRRAALQVLTADARTYCAGDCDTLDGIARALETAFPETVRTVEKKGLFGRTPAQQWVCTCSASNDLGRNVVLLAARTVGGLQMSM